MSSFTHSHATRVASWHTGALSVPRCRGASLAAGRGRPLRVEAAADSQATAPVSNTRRRVLIDAAGSASALLWTASCGCAPARAFTDNGDDDPRNGKVAHTDAEWRALLPGPTYAVLRKASTELPWSSPLAKEHRAGVFSCAGCSSPLFSSASKYESGTGWPSFSDVIPGSVRETQDRSIPFIPRVEVRCATCEGHLGHVFTDGPPPTGLRYCMNGRALNFEAAAAGDAPPPAL